MEKDVKRFLLAFFVGGIFAVITLFALIFAFTSAASTPIDLTSTIVSSLVLVASSLITVWATGFWGRWGMILFFVTAPVVLIIDSSINPLFPSGTILFASLCYGFKRRNNKTQ
ncbi:hypothetical protein RI845_09930 [Thalassotalea nanhaiensis]|uniref:Uncharacterized protein n=1 Tax=Thalassotalea nanhaiensis TaxID=3065648 RepID=A0ABY9TDA8_9GAMM|nr:hypothetical protein RI845_09930 [Colwelliaceae bacterium SQ345]